MTPIYAGEPVRLSLLRAFSLLMAAVLEVLLFLNWGKTGSGQVCPLSFWLNTPIGFERLASLLLAIGTAELILLALAVVLLLRPFRKELPLCLLPLCYSSALLLPAGLLWSNVLLPEPFSLDWKILLIQFSCGLCGILLSREYGRD